MKLFYNLLFIILAFISFQETQAHQSSVEEQIRQVVNHSKSDQLALLATLVNINSGTSNLEGVHQVGETIKPAMEAMGFKTYWLTMPSEMQRAGTLIAERQGNKGKRILLICHLDTVFAKDSPFQKFNLKGNLATGPGVMDDKGGVVVVLFALKALEEAHLLDDTSITVAFVGDEESAGKPTSISKKPLMDAAAHSDLALEFEPALSLDTAVVSYPGISSWIIETQGKAAHSSEIFTPTVGDGAIFELARILNSMRTQLSGSAYLSFNPGIILGGTTIHYDNNTSQGDAFGKINVVSQTAKTVGDLRYFTPEQKQATEATITSIVNQHLLGTSATVEFTAGKPPMIATAGNIALLQRYNQVSLDLGYGEVKQLAPRLGGAGDLSYVASITSGNLSGLGPVGTGIHSTDETLDINTLPIATVRAAVLIYRLTH